MPYIEQKDRDVLSYLVKSIQNNMKYVDNSGKLNYIITVLVQHYIKEKDLKYQNINDVIGALECAKMEIYRIIVAPYENMKIDHNGHVKCI